MQELEIRSSDGTGIPLTWFEADTTRCALLLLPALGIQSKLYNRLGEQLAGEGCSVCLMEQRGHGRSNLRPARGTRYCLADILEQDIPAALDWMQERTVDAPLLLGGHSLGGHLSTVYSGREPGRLAGVVHLACAFPYYRDYQRSQARMIRLMCSLLPLFSVIPGYYPGQVLGFGGRESIQLMKQWSEWALTGDFDFGGRRGLAQAVDAYRGPVISVAFAKDEFSNEATVQRALSPFTSARITRVQLGEDEQGAHLGHSSWARQPDGVARAVMDWLDTEAIGLNP